VKKKNPKVESFSIYLGAKRGIYVCSPIILEDFLNYLGNNFWVIIHVRVVLNESNFSTITEN
jgi:hypothetical protein